MGIRVAPARLAAIVTTLGGLVALTGWMLQMRIAPGILRGAIEIKVNTAFAFVLCGVSLLILADRASLALQRFAQALAIIAAAIGLVALGEYLFGWGMRIDTAQLHDGGFAANVLHGRMAPFSAAAFIATGISLAAKPIRSLNRVAKPGALFVIAVGSLSLIGYLWNAEELITDRWLPPVAIGTAACFLLLGVGILLSPDHTGISLDKRLAALAAVEVKILTGFGLAVSVLLFGGTYTYRTSLQFAESVEWVAHTQEVRATLADIYGSLAGAELALRDYLISADQAQLAEYQRLTAVVAKHLNGLANLTGDNPQQQRNLMTLKSGVISHIDDMTRVVAAYKSLGFAAAQGLNRSRRQASPARDIRAVTERMDEIEVRLLADRRLDSEHVRHNTLISLLITLAVASALFLALFRGIHREMLARRDARDALRASDQYNRSIIDSSPDCVAILTPQARLIQMTPHGLRMMDIEDFSTVANTDWIQSWAGEDQAAARLAVSSALSGAPGRFHSLRRTHAGIAKWWDVIVVPIRGADGRAERLLTVAREITEVKNAENSLREANRFMDSLIENLPVAVFVKDAVNLRYVRQNGASEKLLGISRQEMLGKCARDFFPPEEADSITAKDRDTLAAGRLVDIPEEIVNNRLLGARTLHTMKLPIMDEAGKPQFLLEISVDITERKLAEQAIRALNAQLRSNAAQLEITNKELESFSYSVSHDLRAPLRAIDGFAGMLEEDCRDRLNDEGRRYLSVIRDNARRMGVLIDDLLAFSRLGRAPLANHEVNFDSMVREVIEEALIGTAPAPRIQVDCLPSTRGDRGLLRQVWVNLIANAIKYSSKAAQPFIEISGRRVGAETQYAVKDNGVGFNMAYVDKLFGVFQRLHRADEFGGTGVGLAIVHRVITRHGGRVWADGKVGHGAVFSFALPNGD
ncbi:MAG: PAS domain-containing protein [Pseudomonadota bacterium]|nr:PAS domain-containing protein [Pseudomonadota bacterium]